MVGKQNQRSERRNDAQSGTGLSGATMVRGASQISTEVTTTEVPTRTQVGGTTTRMECRQLGPPPRTHMRKKVYKEGRLSRPSNHAAAKTARANWRPLAYSP
eukprot:2833178-Pyramimonas_sp.AAC.1